MKPTDFSKYLTDYLIRYLPHERGFSSNTIHSYRDTFMLFLKYMQDQGIKAERLFMKHITKEYVINFLEWLENERGCSVSTKNLRLTTIHSFLKYVQYQNPDRISEYQSIMSIEMKRVVKPVMNYLTIDEMKILLQQPDILKQKGRRDLAILSLMYDSACRVSELINISPQNVRLEPPYTIAVTGKGNKTRIIPLLEDQISILKSYMEEMGLFAMDKLQYPIFSNCWGKKFTRAGILNILAKYVKKAKSECESMMNKNISCHNIRHSKAMHLLQAGVNLVYIRDILGHVHIQTTEIYARADSKAKRDAIQKAYIKVVQDVETKPLWEENERLMDFLKSF